MPPAPGDDRNAEGGAAPGLRFLVGEPVSDDCRIAGATGGRAGSAIEIEIVERLLGPVRCIVTRELCTASVHPVRLGGRIARRGHQRRRHAPRSAGRPVA